MGAGVGGNITADSEEGRGMSIHHQQLCWVKKMAITHKASRIPSAILKKKILALLAVHEAHPCGHPRQHVLRPQ
jgi:hypothetical protein